MSCLLHCLPDVASRKDADQSSEAALKQTDIFIQLTLFRPSNSTTQATILQLVIRVEESYFSSVMRLYDTEQAQLARNVMLISGIQKKTCEYKFHTEFQSHEPEFDYLKSLEIEEKINKIKWCRRQNASHYLLSTNDKTIKLWKVFEKSLKVVAENNLSHDLTPAGVGGGGAPRPNHVSFRDASSLKLPRMTHHDTVVAAVPRRTYANAHAYHINSISVNSDGETFISSDDLRINLWNLNIQDQSFNIVDIKPANMEELTEVITAAEFHPQSCNWFMYASSKGTIKLADMRESALCDQHAKRKYCSFRAGTAVY